MNLKNRIWIHAHPDIDKPIGGVKQLYRISECLNKLGFNSVVVVEDSSFRPSWFDSNVSTLSLKDWTQLKKNKNVDVQIIPETYLGKLPDNFYQLPFIIFNQNFSYTLNSSPKPLYKYHKSTLDLYRHPNLLSIWCVSEHDHTKLKFLFPDTLSCRIVNSVDHHFLSSSHNKKKQLCYMPRKQLVHSSHAIAYMRFLGLLDDWELKPIHNLSQSDVSQIMSSSLVFLSFGYPEGFGLPIVEALCSGCYVIGYTGLGGSELFRPFQISDYPSKCSTYPIQFGDTLSFASAFSEFRIFFDSHPHLVGSQLAQTSKLYQQQYSPSSMLESVKFAIIASL